MSPISKTIRKKLVKFQQESTWQLEIDKVKATLPKDKVELAKELRESKREKERLEKLVSAENTRIEAINQTLVGLLSDEDIEKFTLSDGHTFSWRGDVYVSVKDVDKKAFYDWVDDPQQHEELEFKELQDSYSINYQVIARVTKKRIENQEPLPPGTSVFIKESITITKPHNQE